MIKILVVEDEKALNDLVCSILTESGYEPKACYNGNEALTAMEETSYDMIVTDVMMPEVDGFALAREVRRTDKRIPILFMTALDDKPSKQQGFEIGIDDYVVKPFDSDLLVLRIKALLRRANIERCRWRNTTSRPS